MSLSRRALFKSGSLISLGLGCGAYLTWQAAPDIAMLSAFSNTGGNHFAALLGSGGEILHQVSLPRRSHAAIYNRHQDEALFFCRRPGNQIFVFKRNSAALSQIISANAGRHFYGHGILVDDGRILLATENQYQSGAGVVTVRDTRNNYRVINEIPSHGIGPHELVSFADGSRIAIANGGLRTHPDASRVPLNLNDMKSNVSVVDWQTGALLQQYRPGNHRLSLRHLSLNSEGKIFVGGQLQGASAKATPLVMTAEPRQGLREMTTPDSFSRQQKFYTASVCCVQSNTRCRAVTSFPKGNSLTLWDDEKIIAQIQRRDIAGVCQLKDQSVVFSTGTGDIGALDLDQSQLHQTQVDQAKASTLREYPGIRWDNHLIAV